MMFYPAAIKCCLKNIPYNNNYYWIFCHISYNYLQIFVSGELHPVSDFSRHTLVKPKIYHGREKRQISETKKEVSDKRTIFFSYTGNNESCCWECS